MCLNLCLQTKQVVRKFASAQDLRRAFGKRWAARIMPDKRQQLMRHETIATTMKYYVGQDAEETADVLWNVLGNTSGNTSSRNNRSTGRRRARNATKHD